MLDRSTLNNRFCNPGSLMLALVVAFITMAAMRAQDVPRHERLEIVRDGHVVIELNSDPQGGVIRLFNTKGAEMLVLRTAKDGGASIRVNDQDGTPSMNVQTSGRALRITSKTMGRDEVIFDADEQTEHGEGTNNSIKVLAGQLADLDISIKDLQQQHQRLTSDLRNLRPGQSPEVTLDRMQRNIDELLRDQRLREQELRDLRNNEGRNQRSVDDLRRRIQRLESRPTQ